MKIQAVILGSMVEKISWWQAAEIIECDMRHFREKLSEQHGIMAEVIRVKAALNGADLVSRRASLVCLWSPKVSRMKNEKLG